MPAKETCQFCDNPTSHYCDYILGWNRNRMFHRCDAPLCENCRKQIGICTLGGVDSIDRCPLHVGVEDAFLDVVLTTSEARAIRLRNQFRVVT